MSTRIDHVTIGTVDPDHFENLLVGVFGLEKVRETREQIEQHPVNRLFGWEDGDPIVPRTNHYGSEGSQSLIEVVHLRNAVEVRRDYTKPPQAVFHIGLAVTNLEEIMEKARAMDLEYVSDIVDFAAPGRVFRAGFIRTFGVEFELIERPAA